MARIGGINISDNKKIIPGLSVIYGIGPATAKVICKSCKISEDIRIGDITPLQLSRLREFIENVDNGISIEGELRRCVADRIKSLINIGCYRGIRHRSKLPVRGQNTHGNSRTVKRVRGY